MNIASSAHTINNWRCSTCRLAARARAGFFAIPNNPLIVAAVQALSAGGPDARLLDGGWRQDKGGAPRYEFWSGSGGRIRIRIDAANDNAWTDVLSYSPLTLDAAITMLVGLAADPFRSTTSAPRRASVRLGSPAVLSAKGYKRFGAERDAFGAVIEGELAKVLRLRFDIISYPGFDPVARKWRGSGVSNDDVSLIEVADDDAMSDPFNCFQAMPLRFGAWVEHWLNAGGAMWVSPLPQEILQLDHRDNRGADPLAKKIALLLVLNWGAMRKNAEMRIEVRTLLRRVGELARPGARPMCHAGRLADRLEEALLRLAESGVMPNLLGAEEARALRAANRHWFDHWLSSEIVFRKPSFINDYGAPSPRCD